MENKKQIFSFPKINPLSKSIDFYFDLKTQTTHSKISTNRINTQGNLNLYANTNKNTNSKELFNSNKYLKTNNTHKKNNQNSPNKIGEINLKNLKNIKILNSNTTNYLQNSNHKNNNNFPINSNININIDTSNKKEFLSEVKILPEKKYILSHSVFFKEFSKFFPAKTSDKSFGFIGSYAANSNLGKIKEINEDRISIIQNVIKPLSRKDEEWPKVSFFAIYDGQKGIKCSDFLKENLHHYVCKILNKIQFIKLF
jgi:hypothetical protein